MTPSNPMSLEQVRDELRKHASCFRTAPSLPTTANALDRLADAIDAELKRRESEAVPSNDHSHQWIVAYKEHLLSWGLKQCVVDALAQEELSEITEGQCDCLNELAEDVAEWELDELVSLLRKRSPKAHSYEPTVRGPTSPPSQPSTGVPETAFSAKMIREEIGYTKRFTGQQMLADFAKIIEAAPRSP